MSPLEWFVVITAAVSVPAAMLTAVSWWNGRQTNQLIDHSRAQTQALMKSIHDETTRYLDRMDQRAEARYRDLKGENGTDR